MAAIKEINERYQPGKLFVSEHRYHIIMIISQLTESEFLCYVFIDAYISKVICVAMCKNICVAFLDRCILIEQ